MTRAHALAAAFGLFAVWTLATYLLEARVGTFLRPDPTSRFVYTVVANVLIGTIGAALVIREVVRRVELPRVTPYGVARPLRILVLLPLASVLAGLFLVGQELPTSDPVILGNAFAQVLVVSIAEVVVCWTLLGAVLRNALGSGLLSAAIAVMAAALAFGVYHFAHSPPFNTPPIVLLLSGVGVTTGIFFSWRRSVQHHCSAQRVCDSGRDPGACRKWKSRSIYQPAISTDRDRHRGCRGPGHC